MTTLVATLATAMLLSGLALIAPAPAVAATSTPGSDCGCPTTGPYVAPKAPVDPEIEPDGSSAASSPKYRVVASGTWPDVSVEVRRIADGHVMLTANGVPDHWGFSPDQERFVTWGVLNSTFYVQLYDLTATNPGQPLWGTSTLSSENRVAFSPHGKFLAFTWQNNVSTDTVQHQFVDTSTGREFDVSYSYYIPAAGKKFGEVGFGFSPDANDRSFFTSYVTGQTTIQNELYDLPGRATTWSHQRVGTGFWRFSPCGDVLGVVEQDGQIADNVTLIRVSDGQQLAAQSYPIAYIALRTTSASHIVSVDNVDQPPLAPNTAAATCADTQAPTWPAGADLTASNVAKTSLTLTWPAATDDKAVTQYKVYRGTTLLTTLGGTARTYNVTGLTQGTSYTFKVQAGDAAGNLSTDGPSVTVKTAADAPGWPAGTTVVGNDVGEDHATLRWGAASGTVASYKVYRDGTLVGTVSGSTRSYAVTGLAAATSYLFKIEAVGSTGAESRNGPAVRIRTTGFQQLETPEITGTLWWDDNADQVRDETEDTVDRQATPDIGVYAYRIVDDTVVEGPYGAAVHLDGTYTIDNAVDGDYVVSLVEGRWAETFPSDYQPHRVTVSGGHGVGGVDFGMNSNRAFPTQGTGSGSISATITGDGGGQVDGARVHCYYTSLGSGCGGNGGTVSGSTLSLTNLTPGTYELGTELQPHQWQTSPVDEEGNPLKHVIVVGSNGAGGGSASFTVLQGASTIVGDVYDDKDGDGVRGPDEGAFTAPDGVSVCMSAVGGSEQECAYTDGSYQFGELRPGDYEVWVEDYEGWHQTQPAADPVLVHVGTNGDTVEAGLLGAHNPRGVVEGLVWDDRDADGKHDAGEPGLPDVVVCSQAWGQEGWDCLTTDADGRYTTGLVRIGERSVWVPAADGLEQTFPAPGTGHDVIVTDGGRIEADFGLNDGTVVPEVTEPEAPTDVVAEPGVEAVTLSWTAPANDGGAAVTGYVVERETADGWVEVGTPTDTTLEVTGLTGGEVASFRVAAVNEIGRGAWSDVVSATPEPRVVVPGAPEAVTATAGIEKVSLAWSAPAEDGGAAVSGYVVQRETADGWVEVGTPADTALEVTGLTAGTPVTFRVAAVNEAGRGAWSDVAGATPLAKPVVTAPSAPTGLTATVSSNRRLIKLGWQAPASNGGAPVTDYVVQVTVFPLFGWWVVNDGVSTATTATITSPLPGLKLYYRVAARNSAGLGAWSTPLRAG